MCYKYAAAFLLCLAAFAGFSQSRRYPGPFGEKPKSLAQLNARNEGRLLEDFSATASDGAIIDNQSLTGRITLLLFWYPSIGFSDRKYQGNYLKIDSIAAMQRLDRRIQIISLMPDTSGLTQFQKDNPGLPVFRIARLASYNDASRLTGGGGMPTCLLIDQNGIIACVSHLGVLMDQGRVIDKIKFLMMPGR